MSLFGALDISASGLTAERLRMNVTAENLANAQTTRGADGGAYKRKLVVLEQADGSAGPTRPSFGSQLDGAMGGVKVAQVAEDSAPDRMVYDPSHPDADANGYVHMPNVNPVTEMVDLISASRSYEANVTAMQTAKQMYSKTLDILR
ncbi:MAG TPA: flagellar basal body rod protein FlgC [Thermoleophilaceae bacterium]